MSLSFDDAEDAFNDKESKNGHEDPDCVGFCDAGGCPDSEQHVKDEEATGKYSCDEVDRRPKTSFPIERHELLSSL